MNELEDYLYISDRKVDSYRSQLPAGIFKNVSSEVAVNLGLISSKLSSKDVSLNRVSRMLLVRTFVENHYDIGTTEFPGVWVQDELTVKSIKLADNPSVFLLLGLNRKNEVCGLLGSATHIVGNVEAEGLNANLSFFPNFAEQIASDIKRFDQSDVNLDHAKTVWEDVRLGGINEDEVCDILFSIMRQAKGISFQAKFLARTVFQSYGDFHGDIVNVKLFTPLYVSY